MESEQKAFFCISTIPANYTKTNKTYSKELSQPVIQSILPHNKNLISSWLVNGMGYSANAQLPPFLLYAPNLINISLQPV